MTARLRRLAAGAAALAATSAALVGTSSSAPAQADDAAITWTLVRAENPSADQLDAYARITDAMDRAVARYNRLLDLDRHMTVFYEPGVPTAEGSIDGVIRFGANRGFMQERTALHELSHTVGTGTSGGWYALCQNGVWAGPTATALVRSWDGPSAQVNCGGSHIWPYGLNYDDEMSELNADRHVDLVEAMIADGQ